MTTRALLLNGAVGVGKTTTVDAVGDLLAASRVPHALIDLDQLRRAWPAPPGDRFQQRLELANLTAVAATYVAHGAEVLVLAGVVEDRSARAAYDVALGCPVRIVRLVGEREVVRARLRARHVGDEKGLAWHLARHDELTRILDDAGVDDAVVDVEALPPREVAALALAAAEI